MNISYNYRRRVWPYLRDPRKKAYTLMGITLVALSIFGAFAIRPSLSTIFSLRKEVQDLRNVDALLDDKISNLSLAQSRYKTIKKDLYLLDVALPENPEVPTLLQVLNSFSGRSGVTISDMQFDPAGTSTQKLQTKKAKIAFTGTYPQVLKFLELLENSLYQINVLDLSVTLRSKLGPSYLDVKLDLETYYANFE